MVFQSPETNETKRKRSDVAANSFKAQIADDLGHDASNIPLYLRAHSIGQVRNYSLVITTLAFVDSLTGDEMYQTILKQKTPNNPTYGFSIKNFELPDESTIYR